MRRLIVAAVMGAAACGSGSGGAAPQYTAYGFGMASCGSWTTHEGHSKALDEAWALGFFSGAGWAGHKMRGTDRDGLILAVDKHCEQFPTVSIADAAAAVAAELEQK